MKICGLTRPEDVILACRLGAWAVGFVFASSPRRMPPPAVRELLRTAAEEAQAPLPVALGVFGDSSAQEIAAMAEEAGLDGVQLHGLAGPGGRAVRAALAGRSRPLLIVQAVPVDPEAADAAVLARSITMARAEADVVLLDTKRAGRFGGSGTAFPWALARQAADGGPLLVAGGIGPQNVRDALSESSAWGVDVSSGVEYSPGVKDPLLMEKLFAQVRAVPGARIWPGACSGAAAGAGAIPSRGEGRSRSVDSSRGAASSPRRTDDDGADPSPEG